MVNWHETKIILKSIEAELNQKNPNFESVSDNIEKIRLRVPNFSPQKQEPAQRLPIDEVLVILLSSNLDQLEWGIANNDADLIDRNISSALQIVQKVTTQPF